MYKTNHEADFEVEILKNDGFSLQEERGLQIALSLPILPENISRNFQ